MLFADTDKVLTMPRVQDACFIWQEQLRHPVSVRIVPVVAS